MKADDLDIPPGIIENVERGLAFDIFIDAKILL
jgi:hypothetical protein